MKTLKNLSVIIFLFCCYLASASNLSIPDPTYFAEFRKNEQPKSAVFKEIDQNNLVEKGNYYVIYKTNEKGEGYYFKLQFDKKENLIGTSYANADANLSSTTIEKLREMTTNLLQPPLTDAISADPSPTRCVINCNRKEGCYNKESNEAVLVCSTTCILGCD